MGGVDGIDQNLAVYTVNLRSKKWWWPHFRLVLDVSVYIAFQLYRMRETQAREKKLDPLGFRRSIVNGYYRLYRKDKPFKAFFRGSRRL